MNKKRRFNELTADADRDKEEEGNKNVEIIGEERTRK